MTDTNSTLNTTLTSMLDQLMSTSMNTPLEYHRCDPTSPLFNCTIDEFLLYQRGPQQLPLSTALLVSLLLMNEDVMRTVMIIINYVEELIANTFIQLSIYRIEVNESFRHSYRALYVRSLCWYVCMSG